MERNTSAYCKLGITLVIVVVIFSHTFASCDDYKIFILSDVTPKTYLNTNFSIEYPIRYQELFVHNSSPSAIIVSSSPPGIGTNSLPDISLWISIFSPPDDSTQHYIDFLEEHLRITREHNGNEFEIIDRFPTTVDGAEGEQVVYRFIRDPIPDLNNEETPAISYRVYFGCEKRVWLVNIDAIFGKAEQAKEEFENVIRTFKFLD